MIGFNVVTPFASSVPNVVLTVVPEPGLGGLALVALGTLAALKGRRRKA